MAARAVRQWWWYEDKRTRRAEARDALNQARRSPIFYRQPCRQRTANKVQAPSPPANNERERRRLGTYLVVSDGSDGKRSFCRDDEEASRWWEGQVDWRTSGDTRPLYTRMHPLMSLQGQPPFPVQSVGETDPGAFPALDLRGGSSNTVCYRASPCLGCSRLQVSLCSG